jgi:hypothetical protein
MTVDELGALLEACHWQATVKLALPGSPPLEANINGADLTKGAADAVVWLTIGEPTSIDHEAWQSRHALQIPYRKPS